MSKPPTPPLTGEDSELPTLEQSLSRATQSGTTRAGTTRPGATRSGTTRSGEITSDAALETLSALQTFSYRSSEGAPRLGLRFRGVPQTNLAKGERYAPMDLLIVLTRVVQEQQQDIERLQRSLDGSRDAPEGQSAGSASQSPSSSGSSST